MTLFDVEVFYRPLPHAVRQRRRHALWNKHLKVCPRWPTKSEVGSLTHDTRSTAGGWERKQETWDGRKTKYFSHGNSSGKAEIRSSSRRIDSGRRAAGLPESADFEIERGFNDAMSRAGARIIDRTAILRKGALAGDTSNVQAIETRALLTNADFTMEVVALGMPQSEGDQRWRIVVRDIAHSRIVAQTTSSGNAPKKIMPYVAGEHGFVRMADRGITSYERGQWIAAELMSALANSL